MHHGGIAQLVEHLPCKQAVAGSTPVSSTKKKISSMLSLINKDKILSSLKKTIGVVMADCKVG